MGVAVEEYGKAVDARGRLLAREEFQEAVDFLADARTVAARLAGDRGPHARAVLDTLVAAVAAKRPPTEVEAVHARFAAALGPEGALELPPRPVDLARGRAVYVRNCASCHGAAGLGDGPAARAATTPPPAIGSADVMRGVTPALMYRVVSVGVAGTAMPAWAGTLTPAERWDVVAYVNTLRAPEARVRQGEGLFLQRCAGCHGAAGEGDGALTRALSTQPPDIGTFAWQAERSDAQLAAVLRAGVPGTAMPPAHDLTDAEVASVVAYVRALGVRQSGPPPAVAGDTGAAAARVLAQLDEALAAARAGRAADAGDRAFDAYIAFEPLETRARARSPGLVAAMERHFAEFKGAVRAGDLRDAERARDAVEAGLPEVLALTRPGATGGWGAFLQSFLIIVREGFEAILVLGAVVAFLVKTGHRERLRAVWAGAGLGLLASGATAVVLATVLSALPASREVLEGATMLVSVAVLFSVSYWLISKAEAARWQQFIRDRVSAALAGGGGRALALVAFLAVYREGAETALFYQALFREGPGAMLPLSLGIAAGAAALSVIFTLFYRYGVRIPMRPFFTVTSALLYAMAFVFMGRGVRELQEGNVLPIRVIPNFPTVDALGVYPSWEGVLAQLLLLLLVVVALVKTFWPKRSVVLPTAGPPPSAPSAVAALEARLALLEESVAALRTALGPDAAHGSPRRDEYDDPKDDAKSASIDDEVRSVTASLEGARR